MWESILFWLFNQASSTYLRADVYGGMMHRLRHSGTEMESDSHSTSNHVNLFALIWQKPFEYADFFDDKTRKDLPFRKPIRTLKGYGLRCVLLVS